MLELKFDPANKSLAAAIGRALTEYGTDVLKYSDPSPAPAGKLDVLEYSDPSPVTTGELDVTTGELDVIEDAACPAATDDKGVGRNPDFCSNAKIPFNQTGKKKGQWKKKQGVDETAYDEWYAGELANVSTTNDAPVDTGVAFGNTDQAANAEDVTFANAGEFMAWVSEQQTADRLTQADIDSAYQVTSTKVHDLFNPELFNTAVGALYQFLKPIAAGRA